MLRVILSTAVVVSVLTASAIAQTPTLATGFRGEAVGGAIAVPEEVPVVSYEADATCHSCAGHVCSEGACRYRCRYHNGRAYFGGVQNPPYWPRQYRIEPVYYVPNYNPATYVTPYQFPQSRHQGLSVPAIKTYPW